MSKLKLFVSSVGFAALGSCASSISSESMNYSTIPVQTSSNSKNDEVQKYEEKKEPTGPVVEAKDSSKKESHSKDNSTSKNDGDSSSQQMTSSSSGDSSGSDGPGCEIM